MTPAELDRWPDRVVDMFLDGCVARDAKTGQAVDFSSF